MVLTAVYSLMTPVCTLSHLPPPLFFFLEVRLHISSCYRSILDLIWPDWTMGLLPEACFVQSHPPLCWWQILPFRHSDRSLGILATVFLMFHLWSTPIVWQPHHLLPASLIYHFIVSASWPAPVLHPCLGPILQYIPKRIAPVIPFKYLIHGLEMWLIW